MGSHYGTSTYNPTVEVAGWPQFIADFPHHSAVDDATYRLGRNYELLDDNLQAAAAYMQVQKLPDGDIHYDAEIRLIYLLDVAMSAQELSELVRTTDPELSQLHWPARYELALRASRRQEWGKAAAALDEALLELQAQAKQLQDDREHDWLFAYARMWPEAGETVDTQLALLIGRLEKQVALVQSAAALALQVGDPEAEYQLAALVYHNPQLFYSHLWGGWRTSAWVGAYVRDAQLSAAGQGRLSDFMQTHTHAWQAYELFNQLAAQSDTPPHLLEKALFSAGMSLYRLSLYGLDTYYWFDAAQLRDLMVGVFAQFAAQYPNSTLADDALLMVGVYSINRDVLVELVQRYPTADKAAIAQQMLSEWDDAYWMYTDPLLSRIGN